MGFKIVETEAAPMRTRKGSGLYAKDPEIIEAWNGLPQIKAGTTGVLKFDDEKIKAWKKASNTDQEPVKAIMGMFRRRAKENSLPFEFYSPDDNTICIQREAKLAEKDGKKK